MSLHRALNISILKENNPFITRGYNGPELFCDRGEETRSLVRNAENGVSTTLISIRRMGKTCLIWHTMEGLF
jgi:hypothetical protein